MRERETVKTTNRKLSQTCLRVSVSALSVGKLSLISFNFSSFDFSQYSRYCLR